MKNLIPKFLTTLLIVSCTFGVVSCSDDDDDNNQRPVIGSIDPMPDAGGNVTVLQGDVVTIYGRNLQSVSSITFGANSASAAISEHTESKIVFTMPLIEELTSSTPAAVKMKVYAGQTLLMERDYYVAGETRLAITSSTATTAEERATVGTVVTLKGTELDLAVKITVGDATVLSSDFLTHEVGEITFKMPADNYTAGTNSRTLTIYSDTDKSEFGSQLRICTPNPVTMDPQTVAPILGSSIVIYGEYMDLVESVYIGDYRVSIMGQDKEKVTVRFPVSIPLQDPVEMVANLKLFYGDPLQEMMIYSGFRLNTSPQADTMPEVTAITSENGDRYYLKNKVTVTGVNIQYVEGIKVGDLAVPVVDINKINDTSLTFNIPEDYDFTTATTLPLMIQYDNIDFEMGQIKVYPFYYFKGIKMGVQSNAAGSASGDGTDNAVTVLTTGTVYPTSDLFDDLRFDKFAYNGATLGTSGVMTANCVIDQTVVTSATDYYSVPPYIYACTNSSHQIRLTGAGSGSGSNFRYLRSWNSGKTGFTQRANVNPYWGTPMILFRNLTADGDDAAWHLAVENGTLETVLGYDGTIATAGDHTMAINGAAESSGSWTDGSVILVQYLTYEFGIGSTPIDDHTMADVYQTGFMHITGLTCVDANNLALSPRSGFITFDLYWPKQVHE